MDKKEKTPFEKKWGTTIEEELKRARGSAIFLFISLALIYFFLRG